MTRRLPITSPSDIRVFVIANVRLYRDGLVHALSEYPVINVLGAAAAVRDSLLFGDIPAPFIVLDTDGRRLQAYARSFRQECDVAQLPQAIRTLATSDVDSSTSTSVIGGSRHSTGSGCDD
jgi:hypothetical protein